MFPLISIHYSCSLLLIVCDRQSNGPQRNQCPNPCYVTWQGGMEVLAGTETTKELRLKHVNFSVLPRLAQCNPKGT